MSILYNDDCLKILPKLESDSVDLCIADLPYGQTRNDWDRKIPLNLLWKELKRVVKPNGAIILFGQGMFTAEVMMSNPRMWRYNLIWDKKLVTGFLNANRMPLRRHEDIMVFYQKAPTYNPQKVKGNMTHSKGRPKEQTNNNYGYYNFKDNASDMKHPASIIAFSKPHPSIAIHPTEKPVELMEWLIRTYSNENDTVLDFCMGCGATGVACRNTNRKFIGVELDPNYFEVAKSRFN